MINMENDIVNLTQYHWIWLWSEQKKLNGSDIDWENMSNICNFPLFLPWGSISVEPLKKSGRIDSVLRMIQPTALPCPTNALRFGCWLECISYHFALSNEIIFIKCGEQNQLTFAGYGFTPVWQICPALSEYWNSEFWIPYLINHLNCISSYIENIEFLQTM